MAGRWAQLTVDAHIARAIDYAKPIKPFVERAILDTMERQRMLSAYDIMRSIGAERLGDLATITLDTLFTWIANDTEKSQNSDPETTQTKINILERLKHESS